MATKKPKYNPDDVERWVTVRGARIPIMKDGTMGVGVEGKNEKVKEEKKTTSSKNAKYDTSRTGGTKVAETYSKVQELSKQWNEATNTTRSIRQKLENEYLKKNYGLTRSKLNQTNSRQINRQAMEKYVSSNAEYKKARLTEQKLMSEHSKTTAILKQEYEKYRKAGGIQNADWYRASREWDDRD